MGKSETKWPFTSGKAYATFGPSPAPTKVSKKTVWWRMSASGRNAAGLVSPLIVIRETVL